MNQDEALNLSRLLSDGETAELRAAEEHLAAKCRHEQMSRTAVLMNWGDPREWKPAAGAQAAQRTPNLSGCEVMVDGEGVRLESGKPFGFTCCDCGLTHRCVIVSEDGKPVGFAIERDQKATEEIRASTPEPLKLWLWKNFVDGRPEYWAFDNPYPCMPGGGDPLTLGEPCGYALVKESSNGRPDVPEEKVLAAINRTRGVAGIGRRAAVNKHHDCKNECQQAMDYGVWPERSCSPVCVYLRRDERMAGEIEYDSWPAVLHHAGAAEAPAPSEPTPPPGMEPNYCNAERCTCRMGFGYVACDQQPKWKPTRGVMASDSKVGCTTDAPDSPDREKA